MALATGNEGNNTLDGTVRPDAIHGEGGHDRLPHSSTAATVNR